MQEHTRFTRHAALHIIGSFVAGSFIAVGGAVLAAEGLNHFSQSDGPLLQNLSAILAGGLSVGAGAYLAKTGADMVFNPRPVKSL